MAKPKKRGPGPVPPGNQSPYGPQSETSDDAPQVPEGAPASEKDAKGRLGNYGTAGEHPIGQPGGKQGADR